MTDPEADEWAPPRGRDPGNPFTTASWALLSLAALMAALGPHEAFGLLASVVLVAAPAVVLLWWLTLLGQRGPRELTARVGLPLIVGAAVAGFPLLAGEPAAFVPGLAAGALSAVVVVAATRADRVPTRRRLVRRALPLAVGLLLLLRLVFALLVG